MKIPKTQIIAYQGHNITSRIIDFLSFLGYYCSSTDDKRGAACEIIFYLVSAIIGTVVPWVFFFKFFNSEGLNIPLFFSSLFVNGAAGGFSADVLISILVFWVWSYSDAEEFKTKNWWIILPASFTVELSLALPLHF